MLTNLLHLFTVGFASLKAAKSSLLPCWDAAQQWAQALPVQTTLPEMPNFPILTVLHVRIALQFIQVTDPAIIAEALRSRELDKKPLAGGGINNFASPKGYLSLLTSPSNERWKAVRCFSSPLSWLFSCISLVITDHRTSG